MKRRAVIAALVLVAVAAGCGGSGSAVQVHLTVTSHDGRKETTARYTLGCSPLSGSLPLRAAVCRDIARHRQAMLRPRRGAGWTCAGAILAPIVQVDVVRGANGSSFSGEPGCTWPGGTPLAIYWAASQNDAAALRQASARLRCDDEPMFFKKPFPRMSVVACVRGLWTPAAERTIRVAKTAPRLQLLRAGSLFPAEPGVVSCRIAAGGPSTHAFDGQCGVSLTGPASSKVVHFVETWGQGQHTFRHHWTVRGSTLIAEDGPIVPQLWR
jgi:hypothetical protein